MPFDKSRYPANWSEISRRIRERDGNKCKWCGAENHQPHPVTGSKVVLTVAHILNEDPMDVREENLAALCQRCHNTFDAPMRVRHRREKARQTQIDAGQMGLPE